MHVLDYFTICAHGLKCYRLHFVFLQRHPYIQKYNDDNIQLVAEWVLACLHAMQERKHQKAISA